MKLTNKTVLFKVRLDELEYFTSVSNRKKSVSASNDMCCTKELLTLISRRNCKGTKNDILREAFSNFVARKQKLERTHIAVNKSSSNVMVIWYFTYVPRFLELDFHSFHDSCMLIGFLTFSGSIEM